MGIMGIKTATICLLLAFLLFPPLVLAHPGRTASDGCHYCRTNCDNWGVPWNVRHCHGGAPAYIPPTEYIPPPTRYIPPATMTPRPLTHTPIPPTHNPTPTKKVVQKRVSHLPSLTVTPKTIKNINHNSIVNTQLKKSFWGWLFDK